MAPASLRAVLFDLDGTLLELDLRTFLGRYFRALREVLAGMSDSIGPDALLHAVLDATEAMSCLHDGETNREVFDRRFGEITGIDLAAASPLLDSFYEEVFPGLRGDSGPARGGRRAAETAIGLGLRTAVATNPIFPLRAIQHRIAWAGVDDLAFDLVTSYETARAAKPHAAYYRQIAEGLGVVPSECMMVGDDPVLDMAAADVGMATFFVGTGTAGADYSGDMETLADLLPRLAAG